MPTPPGFNNHVRRIDTPTAANLNTEIAAQNLAEYWLTDIKFLDEDTAFLLFCKNSQSILGISYNQKVNEVAADQWSIDADKTTEQAIGYWPTGIFPTPGGTLLIGYTHLDEPPLP